MEGWVSNTLKKEKRKGVPGMPTFLSLPCCPSPPLRVVFVFSPCRLLLVVSCYVPGCRSVGSSRRRWMVVLSARLTVKRVYVAWVTIDVSSNSTRNDPLTFHPTHHSLSTSPPPFLASSASRRVRLNSLPPPSL